MKIPVAQHSCPACRDKASSADCPKCVALTELVRQVAFADPDKLPAKVRAAYSAYRKAVPRHDG